MRSSKVDPLVVMAGLLADERARSDDLLEKLLLAVSAQGGNSDLFAPRVIVPPPGPNWPALQPEDEAKEDVLSQVRAGAMAPEEAKAILEALGFPDADVDIEP